MQSGGQILFVVICFNDNLNHIFIVCKVQILIFIVMIVIFINDDQHLHHKWVLIMKMEDEDIVVQGQVIFICQIWLIHKWVVEDLDHKWDLHLVEMIVVVFLHLMVFQHFYLNIPQIIQVLDI